VKLRVALAVPPEPVGIVNKGLGVVADEFVLGGRGEGAVTGDRPWVRAFKEFYFEMLREFPDAAAAGVLEVLDEFQFLPIDACRSQIRRSSSPCTLLRGLLKNHRTGNPVG